MCFQTKIKPGLKTLSVEELKIIIEQLNSLNGYQVQGVYGSDGFFALKLWKNEIKWIYVCLSGAIPFLYGPDELIRLSKRPTKPVFKFFNSHFKESFYKKSDLVIKYGRLIKIEFENNKGDDLSVEVRLFRGGVNFGVFKNEKKVFLNKPKILEELPAYESKPLETVRTLIDLKSQMLDLVNGFRKKSDTGLNQSIQDQKRKTAIEKIREAIAFHKSDPYKKAAKLLEKKEDIPKGLKLLLKKDKSDQENIIYLYEQHKLKNKKIERLTKRLEDIEKNISLKSGENTRLRKGLKPEIQGIPRFNISDSVTAFCGRKAKENLSLIRKAKAWYLWMHLKDYPSAHVIVEKNKSVELNENDLKSAALFLFSRGAPKKLLSSSEVKFEVVFTECRYVKPIKGDKLGRVTAQNLKSRLYLWQKDDRLKF